MIYSNVDKSGIKCTIEFYEIFSDKVYELKYPKGLNIFLVKSEHITAISGKRISNIIIHKELSKYIFSNSSMNIPKLLLYVYKRIK